MANQFVKRLIRNIYYTKNKLMTPEVLISSVYVILDQSRCHSSEADKIQPDVLNKAKDAPQVFSRPKVEKRQTMTLSLQNTALVMMMSVMVNGGSVAGHKSSPSSRSLTEILATIQRSKIGIGDWSLSDLAIGLYLIFLRQASLNPFEDVKGVQITSEAIVQDLIYHVELAKGSYKGGASGLARHSMLQESNILKFEKYFSMMRPGYYIGIDPRKKLVIFGIRGTHNVYDLITDIVSSNNEEVTFEGYSTHFGTAEAARWFLRHEIGTIRHCLENHEGYQLRLVGHSLGGATASLLAIMLRKKSFKELGFSPDIVSAVGYATPPCVSRELAESCSDFVTTVVMQDDIIPRLSITSLSRLRSEILRTDWLSVVDKGDWKNVLDMVTNAKQMVSSMQDVARKLSDYAKLRCKNDSSDVLFRKESSTFPIISSTLKSTMQNATVLKKEESAGTVADKLFVPGTVYCLKRDVDTQTSGSVKEGREFFTLWKRHPGEHFQRIVLSGNIISDHKCDNHFYALRDVLKGLPGSSDEWIFR
ncbi:uncharacterized protein LOC123215431 [Mangifera indica]|uniref:uncharacterized protein LOC123215431 n=1 Tax=Mangifera indica TaxID=29780 RepID=UPI001CF9D91F|nr:uncharacterized protein LOC123215431 [Mangifera indica]